MRDDEVFEKLEVAWRAAHCGGVDLELEDSFLPFIVTATTPPPELLRRRLRRASAHLLLHLLRLVIISFILPRSEKFIISLFPQIDHGADLCVE